MSFCTASMLCHLRSSTAAGFTSQFSLGPTPAPTLIRFPRQRGKHLPVESAKAEEEDILQTHNCTSLSASHLSYSSDDD